MNLANNDQLAPETVQPLGATAATEVSELVLKLQGRPLILRHQLSAASRRRLEASSNHIACARAGNFDQSATDCSLWTAERIEDLGPSRSKEGNES